MNDDPISVFKYGIYNHIALSKFRFIIILDAKINEHKPLTDDDILFLNKLPTILLELDKIQEYHLLMNRYNSVKYELGALGYTRCPEWNELVKERASILNGMVDIISCVLLIYGLQPGEVF